MERQLVFNAEQYLVYWDGETSTPSTFRVMGLDGSEAATFTAQVSSKERAEDKAHTYMNIYLGHSPGHWYTR
jgi:hypothetical protein